MKYPTVLFVSPKRGGILQSSGFLDMKSLTALSQTCQSNAYDELSLIQLIENELTRNHQVDTIGEALVFWKDANRKLPLCEWLERADNTSIVPTREMLFDAVEYDVMLDKMLKAIPESQVLQAMTERDELDMTVLHRAAFVGHVESVRLIINRLPVSERLSVLMMKNGMDQTVLHCATFPNDPALIQFFLNMLPESHLGQFVSTPDTDGRTALHWAAYVDNFESIQLMLTPLPETPRTQLVNMRDASDMTVLHYVARSCNPAALLDIIALVPESQRLETLCVHNLWMPTIFHILASTDQPQLQQQQVDTLKEILAQLSESERMQVVRIRDREGHTVLDLTSGSTRESIMELLPNGVT